MPRVILDIGDESPQTCTESLESADILLTRAEYCKINSNVRHIPYCNNFELFDHLKKIKTSENPRLVIFYDSKRKLPFIFQIAKTYGYFNTKIVYGSKCIFWHTLSFWEVYNYILSVSWIDFFKSSRTTKPEINSVTCRHSGSHTIDNTTQGNEPVFDCPENEKRDEPSVGCFSPIFYHYTCNQLEPISTVNYLGPVSMHAQLDGLGAGAYCFSDHKKPMRFPYFYYKDAHSMHPLVNKELKGGWVNLTCFSNGYAHWMLDTMPALYLAKEKLNLDKQLGLIVNSFSKYQTDSLKLLGLDDKDVHILEPACCLDVENLVDITIPINTHAVKNGFRPHVSRDYLQPLVNYLVEMAGRENVDTDFPEKIYIKRRKDVERAVINENELEVELMKSGFTSIDLEGLSLVKQIALFQRAKIVISAHGAGLANLIFGSELKVIELMHPHIVRPHFYHISHDWGFKYDVVVGRTLMNYKTPGFYVDVNAVVKKLEKHY